MASREQDERRDRVLGGALERVRGGDRSAFAEVVAELERPLRLWLMAHAPPTVEVEDVAQRSFVAAFTELDGFEPGTDFVAWLFTIARFQLMTEVTRTRRVSDNQARLVSDLVQREQERSWAEPAELQEDRLRHLRRCIDGLADHLRRFVEWRYEEEVSLEVMAERSGRSVSAVKKQLWKVRRRLHGCVEDGLRGEGVEA